MNQLLLLAGKSINLFGPRIPLQKLEKEKQQNEPNRSNPLAPAATPPTHPSRNDSSPAPRLGGVDSPCNFHWFALVLRIEDPSLVTRRDSTNSQDSSTTRNYTERFSDRDKGRPNDLTPPIQYIYEIYMYNYRCLRWYL